LNIVEPILAQARYQPHAVGLCVPGERHSVITYAQIAALIGGIGNHAGSLGLKAGDVVVVFVDDYIMHALLILGLTHAGIVTISGRNPNLPRDFKIDAILSDAGRTFDSNWRVITVDQSWLRGDGAPNARPQSQGHDICRIIFTSGTTGDAKGVAYSHNMVTERAVRFDYLAGNMLGLSLRTCVDLGFATSLGYLLLIRTLNRGGLLVLPGDTSESVLNACDLYQVDSWIGAPGGLLNLVDYLDQSGGRRCNFRAMLAGGSLLSKALSQRARARACANLISAYGSTETNMVATAPAYITAQTEGAVGYLTPGMTVEIVGEYSPLPAGREGLVRVRGPYNVQGYVGDQAESARAFRDGWFFSGDIGRLTSDNLLIITGRQKTVMNIGGDKVKPEIVEDVLAAFAGVDDAGALSFVNDYGIEEIWAVVVSKSGIDDLALFNYCKSKLPPTYVPRRIVKAAGLPRNEMGKIDRRKLQDIAKADSRN
jgi:acyl-coenzyme A synthetase/AMP-(fatty) acid ligase